MGGGIACHLGLLEGQRAARWAQGVVWVDAVFEDAAAQPGCGVAGHLAEGDGQDSAVGGACEGVMLRLAMPPPWSPELSVRAVLLATVLA